MSVNEPSEKRHGHHHHRRPHWADELLKRLAHIVRQQGKKIMGALEDVTAKMDAIEAANVARGQKLAEDVAELRRLADAASNSGDFAPVLARMQAHADALSGEDVDPNFPAPSPAPPRSSR